MDEQIEAFQEHVLWTSPKHNIAIQKSVRSRSKRKLRVNWGICWRSQAQMETIDKFPGRMGKRMQFSRKLYRTKGEDQKKRREEDEFYTEDGQTGGRMDGQNGREKESVWWVGVN